MRILAFEFIVAFFTICTDMYMLTISTLTPLKMADMKIFAFFINSFTHLLIYKSTNSIICFYMILRFN